MAYWRSQVVDAERPYLWADDEALVYMNEAQKQFCRKTEGISDASTPSVVQVAVETGGIFASVHPSILTFRQAVLGSTGYKLDIVNHTEVQRWDNGTGSVTQMIVGMERNKVRWNRTPTVDDEVTLLVYRLPVDDITDFDQEFEIDALHHTALAFWMSHLAYMKTDIETFNKQASDKARALFEDYCVSVSAEQRRYKQKPRSIAYGGL
jgi:hypothetical protein